MKEAPLLWIDSDVLLDWLGKRQPWNAAAAELIKRAIRGECKLCFSPLTLANVFYTYRKQAGTTSAKSAIGTLIQIGNVVALEAAHIRQALDSPKPDFEDEIQIACAEGIPLLSAIITRNLADYQHSTVAVMTAGSWLARQG